MTTNQTIDGVPREQLVRWEEMLRTPPGRQELLEELRALLDAPVCSNCAGLERNVPCPDCKPAAQPQGEPVANPVLAYADSYRDMARQGVKAVSVWSVITDLERNIAPLYAERAAPVAVGSVVINQEGLKAISFDDGAWSALPVGAVIYSK